jgi:hypothetical protein
MIATKDNQVIVTHGNSTSVLKIDNFRQDENRILAIITHCFALQYVLNLQPVKSYQMTQLHFDYSKKILFFLIVSSSFFLSSCYTYRVATHAQPGTEVSKPFTAHSFFWGLVQKPPEIHTPVCDSLGVNGLAEVTVKNNFGYSLITVATLGIWSPVRVLWKCGKPCKKEGEL